MRTKCLLPLLLLISPALAHAAISIQGSRVIYEEVRGEAVMHLRQLGDGPGLVQVWLDRGDDSLSPQMQDIPFVLTPAVSRIEPGNGQSIRILRVRDDLPQDRESMFFMNVLEVPPAPTEFLVAGDDFVQFSARARSKFFYRPKGLKPQPDLAHQLLRFSLVNDAAQVQVRVYNPSPYHVTFKELKLLLSGAGEHVSEVAELSHTVAIDGRTVAPASELLVPMDLAVPSLPVSGLNVGFEVVGDYGNLLAGQQGLD